METLVERAVKVEVYGVIYRILHPITREVFYIGLTINPDSRFYVHKNSFKRKLLKNRKLCNIEKWMHQLHCSGMEAVFEIIESNIPVQDLSSKEIFYITEYTNLGYKLLNSTKGGSGIPQFKVKPVSVNLDLLSYDELLEIENLRLKCKGDINKALSNTKTLIINKLHK